MNNLSFIKIETVSDLKKALESFPGDTAVRNIFDAGGNYYYPHIALKVSKFNNGDTVIVFDSEAESLKSIRDIVRT